MQKGKCPFYNGIVAEKPQIKYTFFKTKIDQTKHLKIPF